MIKIYDCFTFFNELDLLELRLEELYNHVDRFVLVESDHTFTNKPKPYYFDENRQRFSRFLDKIQHVKIQSQLNSDPWQNEFYQRDCILQGCVDAHDNDIIIVSDVDEIPRNTVLKSIRHSKKDIMALFIPFFYFKLNFVSTHTDLYSPNIVAARKHLVCDLGPENLRKLKGHFKHNRQWQNYDCEIYHHAGWHFTYLGDNKFVKTKFVSFSHASDHTVESVENFDMNNELHEGERRFVKIDEYFPKTVLKNLNKYQQYIESGYEISVRDLFS